MIFRKVHVVTFSIYPFFLRLRVLILIRSLLVYMKRGIFILFIFRLIYFYIILLLWLKDVVREGLSGYHNILVGGGFKLGFMFFILTEVIFFFRIFWVFYNKIFFHNDDWWIVVNYLVDAKGLPIVRTLILLLRRVTATLGHQSFICNKNGYLYFFLTIILGIIFLYFQYWEYSVVHADVRDGIYGCLFYFGTGFHGFHVFLGIVILVLRLVRLGEYHFDIENHIFLECGVIYWHFVDVVWLFLFISFYIMV